MGRKLHEQAVKFEVFLPRLVSRKNAEAIFRLKVSLRDVSPDELQKMIDAAVDDVRAKHYRERAQRS